MVFTSSTTLAIIIASRPSMFDFTRAGCRVAKVLGMGCTYRPFLFRLITLVKVVNQRLLSRGKLGEERDMSPATLGQSQMGMMGFTHSYTLHVGSEHLVELYDVGGRFDRQCWHCIGMQTSLTKSPDDATTILFSRLGVCLAHVVPTVFRRRPAALHVCGHFLFDTNCWEPTLTCAECLCFGLLVLVVDCILDLFRGSAIPGIRLALRTLGWLSSPSLQMWKFILRL